MSRNDVLSADKVHKRIRNGSTLLVCAYDSDEKFQKFHLEGAISLSDFRKKIVTLSKNQEIIFYCN